MDEPGDYHLNKSDRERQISYDIAYMQNLKKNDTNLFTKQKQTHRRREQTYGYWGEGWGRGTDWEFGIDMYTLLYLKQITKKDLLYSSSPQPIWHQGLVLWKTVFHRLGWGGRWFGDDSSALIYYGFCAVKPLC